MNSEDFEFLLERGFHRNGAVFFRPDNEKSCCPQYTMRVDVDKFKINSNHEKLITFFNEFINGEHEDKAPQPKESNDPTSFEKAVDLYNSNLKDEIDTLKSIIINNLIEKDSFISDLLSEENKRNIIDQLCVETIDIEDESWTKMFYNLNVKWTLKFIELFSFKNNLIILQNKISNLWHQ